MKKLFCFFGFNCANERLNAFFATGVMLAIAYVLVRVALLFPSATLAVTVTLFVIAGLLSLMLHAITIILGDWREAWASLTRK